MSWITDEGIPERNQILLLTIEVEYQKIQARRLKVALKDLLAQVLETEPEHLDPKDVMRFHYPSYEVLHIHPELVKRDRVGQERADESGR